MSQTVFSGQVEVIQVVFDKLLGEYGNARTDEICASPLSQLLASRLRAWETMPIKYGRFLWSGTLSGSVGSTFEILGLALKTPFAKRPAVILLNISF